jgi:methanogenic corrinoid protein MtbC1
MAGEIFRETMELLEPLVAPTAPGDAAGKVLICTVQGDIHDLGKNLVTTLLRSNGFSVNDLGVDVPPEAVVRALVDWKPDVVALSAMLVSSFGGMRDTVAAVRATAARSSVAVPIIVGGGQMTEEMATWVGADRWSTNAGEGVRMIRELVASGRGSD